MSFVIQALEAEEFEHFFSLDAEELAEEKATLMTVSEKPGTPCRVSMTDAEVGETVVLLNFQHQPSNSPYQASHAIFVRKGAKTAKFAAGEVPEVLSSRLISVRVFDQNHMMIDADVVQGSELKSALEIAFEDKSVAYIHLHNAKPGCFAASVIRAQNRE